tara:strand:- start:44 stop:286 length:243 start_codon:yes stop_codon:yes gene_type:complete
MNLENLHRQMKIQKLEDITQECVHSWPKSEKYSEFSKMTDIIHWLEKNEELSPDGKKFMVDLEHSLVKLFATKYNADISI